MRVKPACRLFQVKAPLQKTNYHSQIAIANLPLAIFHGFCLRTMKGLNDYERVYL